MRSFPALSELAGRGGMAKLDVDPDEELPGPYGARGKGWDGQTRRRPRWLFLLLLPVFFYAADDLNWRNLKITGGVSLMHWGSYEALECFLFK